MPRTRSQSSCPPGTPARLTSASPPPQAIARAWLKCLESPFLANSPGSPSCTPQKRTANPRPAAAVALFTPDIPVLNDASSRVPLYSPPESEEQVYTLSMSTAADLQLPHKAIKPFQAASTPQEPPSSSPPPQRPSALGIAFLSAIIGWGCLIPQMMHAFGTCDSFFTLEYTWFPQGIFGGTLVTSAYRINPSIALAFCTLGSVPGLFMISLSVVFSLGYVSLQSYRWAAGQAMAMALWCESEMRQLQVPRLRLHGCNLLH